MFVYKCPTVITWFLKWIKDLNEWFSNLGKGIDKSVNSIGKQSRNCYTVFIFKKLIFFFFFVNLKNVAV